MKLKIYFIFLIFLNVNIFSENLNEYTYNIIKIIPAGKKDGELGFDSNVCCGSFPGPITLTISKNNYIYIPDLLNERICKYDMELKFINNIFEKNDKICHFSQNILVDENENLICITSTKGLIKISSNGERLYMTDENILPSHTRSMKNYFFLNNDKILFYDNKKNIKSISEDGKEESNEVTFAYLKKLELQEINSEFSSGIGPETELTEFQQGVIQSVKAEKKNILIGDKLYQSSFYKNREYFEKLQQKELKVVEGQQPLSEETKTSLKSRGITPESDKVVLDLDKYDFYFIEYDKDHNSYWKAEQKKAEKAVKKHLIVIFSRYGELLDAFQFGETFKNHPNTELFETTWAKVAVAPNGDVWFMKGSEKGHTFWKVERQW